MKASEDIDECAYEEEMVWEHVLAAERRLEEARLLIYAHYREYHSREVGGEVFPLRIH